MGLSSSKQTTKSEQTNNQTGTTTPVNPSWVTDSLMDYTGRIGAFGDADPNQFVAGASPLQQRAWNATDRLGLWTGNANAASNIALNAANAPSNLMNGAAGYTAARGNASTYSAPTLANPREATAMGYTAAQGQGTGYAAPTLGNAQQAVGNGFTAAQAGPVNIGPMVNAQASNAGAASGLDNFGAYQSPYTRDVVNAAMADFDQQAGQTRAQQAAQAARAGAFGGSRLGIREAQTEGELARARAATQAGLLDQSFRTAAGLSQFDAGNRQQANLFNAQNQTGVSLANAGAQNQRTLSQAQIDAQLGLSNADARNQAGLFGAAAGNTASLANQQATNQFALTRAGMQENAARYGADATNQFSLANLAAQNQAAQFGAGAQNNASQLNQGASNQFALAQAGMQNDAARYGADAANQFNSDYLGRADAAGQFGAASQNAANQFNAGQMEQGLTRQLQAAGLLNGFGNDFAGNTQRDIALMSDLGGQQRGIEQQYAMAPAAQLQMMGSLFGATPYQIFSGQNVNTSGTATGNSTTKTSGNLFEMMMQMGQNVANAYAQGAG